MCKTEIYITSSLEKIFPHSEPCLAMNKATALQNEKYHFQLVVRSDGDASSLSICVGEHCRAAVRLFDVGLIKGGPAWMEFHDEYYISKEEGLYPDVLFPHRDGFALTGGENKAVYVCVDCSRLPVGENKLTFSVAGASAEFCLTILPCALVGSDLILTNWIHVDCICDQHGVEPFTEAFYRVFDSYLHWYVEMGNNTMFTPIFTPPIDTAVGGERRTVQLVDIAKTATGYAFDFTKLQAFFDFCLARGIRYFEFSQLATQWGAQACPKVVVRGDKGEEKLFGWDVFSDSEEYFAFLAQFLPALCDFVKENGLAERVFFHISDEPKEEEAERYRRFGEYVRKLLGGMKILDTMSARTFYDEGLVDIPAITTRAADCLKEGEIPCLLYYCSVEFDDYYSNRFFCMPLQRTRVLGCQLYCNNAIGFLHWGYNFYYSYLSKEKLDPYEVSDAKGYFPSGDSFLVYPVKDGAVPSLRLMTMLEAFQDYRALKTLEKKRGKEFVSALLATEGVSGVTTYPRSAEWQLAFREKLNALIAE